MQIALDQFLAQVRSIERTLELRDHLEAVGRDSPKNLSLTARGLQRVLRQIGVSGMQPSLDGSALLLAAAFEQFVADVMIAFAEQLPDRIPNYADLPNAIRSANERLTGEALSGDLARSRFTQFDRQRFVDNLRDCQAGVIPYVLNGEAIALNYRNLNSRTLRELFTRLAVEDVWRMVGLARALKRWSGPGGGKAAQSRAQNLLNDLINNRNLIAHRVGSTRPGPDVIRSYVNFERALARSLVKGLQDHANSL